MARRSRKRSAPPSQKNRRDHLVAAVFQLSSPVCAVFGTGPHVLAVARARVDAPGVRLLADREEVPRRVLRDDDAALREVPRLRDAFAPPVRDALAAPRDALTLEREDAALARLPPELARADAPFLRTPRREDALERRRVDRGRRCDAGISACVTAFVNVGINRSRNLAMRSSSRRIERASRAVSESLRISASASIAV
jgi:hypothetical protein